MIGLGSAGSTKILETEVRHPKEANVGFGIGLIDWAIRRDPKILEVAIVARPVLLSVSFGDDWSWVDAVRAAGIVTATQIYDSDQARSAADAGIEILVARGAEGGGHGQPTIGTLPLLESVLDAVDIPVLAAGGITTGRGVAAVLAAGASGVWLGTAFAACPESLLSDPARQTLLRASGKDTVVTSAFDVALGYPWPRQFPERVLRNVFTDQWSGHEAQLARRPRRASPLGAWHRRRRRRVGSCQCGPRGRISHRSLPCRPGDPASVPRRVLDAAPGRSERIERLL